MGPEVVAVAVLGSVVLGLGLAISMFCIGKWSRDYELGRLRQDVKAAENALRAARIRARARARGAASDLERAAALAGADDLDGLLRLFAPGDQADTAPDQPSPPADGQAGGEAGQDA